MKKKFLTLFHGTTTENARRILSGQGKEQATWVCSDDNRLYGWEPHTLWKAEDRDDECGSKDDLASLAIQRAFESGQVTATISPAPCFSLTVLEFVFPADKVEEDFSCCGMDGSGAHCVCLPDYRKYLKAAYQCEHDPRADVLLLKGLIGRDLFASDKVSPKLRRIVESLQGDVCLDELLEFDWKKIDPETL